MKMLSTFSLCLALISCTTEQPDCFIADQTSTLDKKVSNNIEYSLVLRVTGFSDKLEYIELYQGTPEFDVCGNAALKPIYSDSLDTVTSNQVSIHNHKLVFSDVDAKRPITAENIRFEE